MAILGGKHTESHTKDRLGGPISLWVGALLLLGVVPRLRYYLTGRSLWFDEAALCINILERDWAGLLDPLAFKQVAPPLYLWSLKLATTLAGPTVYAVRFPAIVAGCLSLVLFWLVVRRLLNPAGAIAALAMAVMSQHLILYAGEAKPYASDVALALAVLWMGLRWEDKLPTLWRALRYGCVLGVMVWYSFPVVFVIGGVGLTQLTFSLWRREWPHVTGLLLIYGIAAASFLVAYVTAIVPSRGDEETMTYMRYYWRHGFMPFPPTSHWDFRWYRDRTFLFFDMPGGFTLQGLALFVWLSGLVAVAAQQGRRVAFLILPIALTLLASALKLYPFHGRMTLFLAPAIYIGMGAGLAQFYRGSSKKIGRLLVGIAVVLLLAQPGARALRMAVAPSRHHELERVLAYADANWKTGDRLYLRQGDYIAYRFLTHRYDFPEDSVLVETRKSGLETDELDFRTELAAQFGMWGRVWFPMAYDQESAVSAYIEYLKQHGQAFDESTAQGAKVVGVDFGATSGTSDGQ